MGDMGEYWRDVKSHFKNKQSKYEERIAPELKKLIEHPECKRVGNQWRIREWDFWSTGTVMNYKTKERITIKQLLEIIYNLV